jgi:hypothetical protein
MKKPKIDTASDCYIDFQERGYDAYGEQQNANPCSQKGQKAPLYPEAAAAFFLKYPQKPYLDNCQKQSRREANPHMKAGKSGQLPGQIRNPHSRYKTYQSAEKKPLQRPVPAAAQLHKLSCMKIKIVPRQRSPDQKGPASAAPASYDRKVNACPGEAGCHQKCQKGNQAQRTKCISFLHNYLPFIFYLFSI